MYLLTQSWDFRALWMVLPLQTKLFFFCLLLTAGYTTYTLTVIYTRTRSLPDKESAFGVRANRLHLFSRIRNLRQLHFMFFLLFGVILTDDIFRAFRAHEYSTMSLSESKAAEIVDPVLAFAYSCLIIFTVLHLLQWLVSNRLEKIASISE
jgi:hypothetical protein